MGGAVPQVTGAGGFKIDLDTDTFEQDRSWRFCAGRSGGLQASIPNVGRDRRKQSPKSTARGSKRVLRAGKAGAAPGRSSDREKTAKSATPASSAGVRQWWLPLEDQFGPELPSRGANSGTGVAAILLGKFGQHGVGGNHAVSAEAFCGIKGLIRLPENPLGANVAAGDLRRHADAER